jgi:uncharacterized protein (TIGR01777 family)
MKITLTGASGFIGRRLTRRLSERGHVLTLLGRAKWDANSGAEPPLEALEGADAIIHLAGEPVAQRWSAETKRRIRESRVNGTRQLVNALGKLKQKPAVLLSASAIGIYGNRGDESLTEGSSAATGFLADVCVEWEAEALRARALGMRVVMFRTGIVLGSDGGALKEMLTPFRLGLGAPLGSGKQWMAWIHVEDAVSMMVHALESAQADGAWNVVGPNPVRNTEFTQALSGTLHRPSFFPVPEFALKLLFGEMSSIVLASQRVMPAAAIADGFTFRYTALKAALGDLLGGRQRD